MAGHALASVGDWLFLVWLLAAGWSLAGDVRDVGLVLAGWLVGRPVVALILRGRHRSRDSSAAAALLGVRTVVAGAMVLFAGGGPVTLLATGALAYGVAAATGAALGARRSEQRSAELLDRLAFVVGPLAGSVLVAVALPLGGAVATVVLAAAAVMLFATARARPPVLLGREPEAVRSPEPGRGAQFEPLPQHRAALFLAVAFLAGAAVAALAAELPLFAARLGLAPLFGVALSLVGAGVLLSARFQHTVPRVHLRLPSPLISAVLAWLIVGMVVVTALLSTVAEPLLALPALVVVLIAGGLALGLLDVSQQIRLRRLGVGAYRGAGSLGLAVGSGHLAGALLVAVFGDVLLGVAGWVWLVAILWLTVVVLAVRVDGVARAAGHFPTQPLSWDTVPAARALDAAESTRARSLQRWINRQVELETVEVTLPVSGRRYAIVRPQEDSRERLFEAGRADPDRQMPFWAKVWPSGVALADVIVERSGEVRGREALELGAGLGVTACTALEEGARLTVADYSLLPLALCRYNTLFNSGRAAGATCFNWRSAAQVEDALRRRPRLGLILAADVLYEARDVMPLLRVIERLLDQDGALWLAEPVRKTAARFLDVAAMEGWAIESRTISAQWPDATNGRVNVHVINRHGEHGPSVGALAGGRV